MPEKKWFQLGERFKKIEQERKESILAYFSILLLIITTSTGILNLLVEGDYFTSIIEFTISIINILVFLFRKKYTKIVSYIFSITIGMLVVVIHLKGGFRNLGLMWTFGYCLVTYPLLGKYKGALIYFSVLLINIIMFVLSLLGVLTLPIDMEMNIIYLVVFAFLGVINYNQENYRRHTEKMIKRTARELDLISRKLSNNILSLNEDLEIAKNIQDAIIPKTFPRSDVINVSTSYLPVEGLGGDYYDVIEISENKLAFVIADVSGHGVPSALIASMAKVLFVNHSRNNLHAGEIIKSINEELCYSIRAGEYPTAFYLTAFYGIIDFETGILEYTSAGHNNVYLLRKNNDLTALSANGPIIGVFDGIKYTKNTEKLEMGDKLILLTDGILEAVNKEGELFGEQRFKDAILKNAGMKAKELVNVVMEKVDEFSNEDADMIDDRTLVIVDIVFDISKIVVDLGVAKDIQERIIGDDDTAMRFKLLNDIYSEAIKNYNSGEYAEAEEHLLNIYKEYNRRADRLRVLNLLGFAYYKQNKIKEAIDTWKEAQNLDPNNKQLEKNIKRLEDILKDPDSYDENKDIFEEDT